MRPFIQQVVEHLPARRRSIVSFARIVVQKIVMKQAKGSIVGLVSVAADRIVKQDDRITEIDSSKDRCQDTDGGLAPGQHQYADMSVERLMKMALKPRRV